MQNLMKITVTLLITFALAACSFSVSTASLSNIKTGSKLVKGEVKKEVRVFPTDAQLIFVSAHLNNAPEDTKVSFTWRYLEGEGQDIDSVEVESKSGENRVSSNLTVPDAGWPPGKYEIILELDIDNSKPVHKKFQVK